MDLYPCLCQEAYRGIYSQWMVFLHLHLFRLSHPLPKRHPRSRQGGIKWGLSSSKAHPNFFHLRKELRRLFRHDMKSIIAETEKNMSCRTPPKDGLSTLKWTPRTPPRAERMPPTPGLPISSSPSKVDSRTSPAITPGLTAVTRPRPDTTSSGLSITRPQGVNPVLAVVKQQAQSPLKVITPNPPAHVSPLLTRTQSAQVSQPIMPVKLGSSSPGIRRASLVSSFARLALMLISIVLGAVTMHG